MQLHFQQLWISFPVKFWQVLHPPEKQTIATGMKLSDHTYFFTTCDKITNVKTNIAIQNQDALPQNLYLT